jgi:dihydroxyacetone kinase-like predicted kinase
MKKLINWIKEQFDKIYGGVIYILIKNGDQVIDITNVIKKIINKPSVNAFVEFTNTKLDDAGLLALKKIVPKFIKQLGLAMAIVDQKLSTEEAFNKVMAFISNLPKDGQAIFLRELSGMLLEAKSKTSENGVEISKGEYVAIIQFIYKGILTKK